MQLILECDNQKTSGYRSTVTPSIQYLKDTIEMNPNEMYGVSTDGIETTPNEVYGVSTDGIETTPNEVYGVSTDGIETTPNEVYGVSSHPLQGHVYEVVKFK